MRKAKGKSVAAASKAATREEGTRRDQRSGCHHAPPEPGRVIRSLQRGGEEPQTATATTTRTRTQQKQRDQLIRVILRSPGGVRLRRFQRIQWSRTEGGRQDRTCRSDLGLTQRRRRTRLQPPASPDWISPGSGSLTQSKGEPRGTSGTQRDLLQLLKDFGSQTFILPIKLLPRWKLKSLINNPANKQIRPPGASQNALTDCSPAERQTPRSVAAMTVGGF